MQFSSLSATASVSSLQAMVNNNSAQERRPLVNEVDVEAGPVQYGGVSRSSLRGDASPGTQTPKRLKGNPKWARRVQYYVPSTAWIPSYSFSLLSGDVLAGVTVAAMLIPQSVSYGTSLAKLSPTTGLFAASIPPIMYSLLGTSRQLNVAPEAALSLLVGQAVSDFRRGDPHTTPGDPDAIGLAVATAITLQHRVLQNIYYWMYKDLYTTLITVRLLKHICSRK
ncbi:sulfate transporter N-terminal domain with GLY motif-domain-containing protein [Hygrophoropsis aurantiaca]|uniref:Sulfate transporter N-terminal domain with GLY motif-domain-containing protein n=1 Tax=Hygrophoropsis aurantiaca TaxID=72124 RepID=A0ACB8A4I3_9AGAM|nr:sulfate transporter N-terminal domain with GLY motif-domain-containing protein [Hygrophoropsis aurantiaca]